MSFKIELHQEVTQVETLQDSALGIMRWGRNNSFPQTLKNLVEQSPTAKPAVARTAQFFMGKTLKKEENILVNKNGLRLNKLLKIVSQDYALYGAFAVHCNYNIKGQVTSMNPMRIADLRFKEFDELNYSNKIGYHPTFSLNTQIRKQTQSTASRGSIKWFDRYNPAYAVDQMAKAGGSGDYLGQLLYYSDEGLSSYPIPRLQAPINYVLSDIENSILMRKETSTGFINSYLLKTTMDAEDPTLESLQIAIEEAQGARGTGKIIVMSNLTEADISGTTLEAIDGGGGSSTIVESVSKAFELSQKIINGVYLIPPVLGGGDQKNGFSGTSLEDAYFVFNAVTRDGRKTIENEINDILENSVFTLKSIKLRKIELDTEEEEEDEESKFDAEDPFAKIMRDMTGKQWQQLQRIHREYKKGKISKIQANIQLTSSYGFSKEMAEEWLTKEDEEDV